MSGNDVKKRIAIIGAGIAGLACARELVQHGHDVSVFEKSRGPGGRMPTRWLNREAEPPVGFDHGTQYFQATAPAFADLLAQAEPAGAVAQWGALLVGLFAAAGVTVREALRVSEAVTEVLGLTDPTLPDEALLAVMMYVVLRTSSPEPLYWPM